MSSNLSWFAGVCATCRYNVVVTQPNARAHPYADYWWYCSNKECRYHVEGEHTEDLEKPDWVKLDGNFQEKQCDY